MHVDSSSSSSNEPVVRFIRSFVDSLIHSFIHSFSCATVGSREIPGGGGPCPGAERGRVRACTRENMEIIILVLRIPFCLVPVGSFTGVVSVHVFFSRKKRERPQEFELERNWDQCFLRTATDHVPDTISPAKPANWGQKRQRTRGQTNNSPLPRATFGGTDMIGCGGGEEGGGYSPSQCPPASAWVVTKVGNCRGRVQKN